MRTRQHPLPRPEGRRYWVVVLGDRGEHHFRFPSYSWALALIRLASECSGIGEEDGWLETTERQLPMFGAVLGLCWRHRAYAIEVEAPKSSSTAALSEYGRGVVDDMQDQYDLTEIQALAAKCMESIHHRIDIANMAAARADFFIEARDQAMPGGGEESASSPGTPST